MLFPVYTTRQKKFALYLTGVIFTCKCYKFGLNTTGLSQSHFRNLSTCSIIKVIVLTKFCSYISHFRWLLFSEAQATLNCHFEVLLYGIRSASCWEVDLVLEVVHRCFPWPCSRVFDSFIYHSIFSLYSPLFHEIIVLLRFNFHCSLYNFAPDKKYFGVSFWLWIEYA